MRYLVLLFLLCSMHGSSRPDPLKHSGTLAITCYALSGISFGANRFIKQEIERLRTERTTLSPHSPRVKRIKRWIKGLSAIQASLVTITWTSGIVGSVCLLYACIKAIKAYMAEEQKPKPSEPTHITPNNTAPEIKEVIPAKSPIPTQKKESSPKHRRTRKPRRKRHVTTPTVPRGKRKTFTKTVAQNPIPKEPPKPKTPSPTQKTPPTSISPIIQHTEEGTEYMFFTQEDTDSPKKFSPTSPTIDSPPPQDTDQKSPSPMSLIKTKPSIKKCKLSQWKRKDSESDDVLYERNNVIENNKKKIEITETVKRFFHNEKAYCKWKFEAKDAQTNETRKTIVMCAKGNFHLYSLKTLISESCFIDIQKALAEEAVDWNVLILKPLIPESCFIDIQKETVEWGELIKQHTPYSLYVNPK